MKTTYQTQIPLSKSQTGKQQPAYTSSLLTKSQQMPKLQSQADKLAYPHDLSPRNQEDIQNSPFAQSSISNNYQKLDNQQLNDLLQQVSNKAISKIEVSPNKQFNLSNNLPIVVFLQSIEIERLLGEVESWKYKYLDLDRRISFRSGLEEQIRKEQEEKVQMQVACQQKIQLWADEIKKYKALSEKSQLEYQQLLRRFELVSEEWREKMKDFEEQCNKQMKDKISEFQKKLDLAERKSQSLIQEIQQLKQTAIAEKNQLTNEFEMQKQQMQAIYKNQMDQLNAEINRLRGLLELGDRERLEFERKLSEYNAIKKQLKEAKDELLELNEKLQKLAEIVKSTSDENRFLKSSNDELAFQNKNFNQKISDLSNLVSNLRNENSKKDEEITELENENSSFKALNDEIKYKLNEALRYLEKTKEQEKKIEMLTAENNQLKNELAQLLNRLKSLENSQDKINQYKARLDELEQLLIEKESQIEDLTNELKKIQKQYNQIQLKYEQIFQNYNEIEQKCNLREKQCEQLIVEAGKWQKKYELIKVQIDGFKELDVIAQEYDQKLAEIVQFLNFSKIKKSPKQLQQQQMIFVEEKLVKWNHGVILLFFYKFVKENKYTDELSKVLNSQEAKDLQNLEPFSLPGQSPNQSFDYQMRYTSKF